ncbi:cell filamentation protein Fic, partial [Acinetobacter baumannii]
MATPAEKLADSLETLHRLQEEGMVAIHTEEISRLDRERLLNSGFLKEVTRGWYIIARPDEKKGDTTS